MHAYCPLPCFFTLSMSSKSTLKGRGTFKQELYIPGQAPEGRAASEAWSPPSEVLPTLPISSDQDSCQAEHIDAFGFLVHNQISNDMDIESSDANVVPRETSCRVYLQASS